jgi:DUF4097 and DUF4098 domain-containing protein YvlB
MDTRFLPAVLLALAAGTAGAQEPVDTRRAAAADGVVHIENPAGSVKVVGWDRLEVSVSGTAGRGAEGVSIRGGGRRTNVEVETVGHPHSVHSNIEVRVPAGSRVEVESFASDVSVSGVTGAVSVECVNGNIEISGATQEVDASAVNGGVQVTGTATRVSADSVNGPVTVRGGSGDVQASTVNGRLVVSGRGPYERAELETVSGSVLFEGALAPQASVSIESVSGGVEVVLPASVAADFNVSTFSGDVTNELGPPAERTNRYTSEKSLEFSTGSGGASVSISTLSGGIQLRKR